MLAVLLLPPLCGWRSATAAGVSFGVDTNSVCVDAAAVRQRVAPLLSPYSESRGGTITVVARKAQAKTVLVLRVVAVSGEVVLERRTSLRPEDCPSAPELVATILERFLRDFPRTRWADIPPAGETSVVLVGRGLPWVVGMLRTSAAAHYPGLGADLEVSGALEVGTVARRLYTSAILRAGTPRELGAGHFLDAFLGLGVGWRQVGPRATFELEARVGARAARGYDFSSNRAAFLPCAEVAGGVAWQLGGWLIGPVAAVTPFRQTAVTEAGAETTLPWVRLGVGVWLPLSAGVL